MTAVVIAFADVVIAPAVEATDFAFAPAVVAPAAAALAAAPVEFGTIAKV